MSQFACSDCLPLNMLLVTQFTFKVVTNETTNVKTIQTLELAFLYFPCNLYSFPISLSEANCFNNSYIRVYIIVFIILTLDMMILYLVITFTEKSFLGNNFLANGHIHIHLKINKI